MWFVGMIVGAVIGAMGRFEGAVIGGIVGIFVGALLSSKSKKGAADTRVATLEEEWLWQQAALEAEVNRARD